MKGFRIILIIGFVLSILSIIVVAIIFAYLILFNTQVKNHGEKGVLDKVVDASGDKMIIVKTVVRAAGSFAWQIYLFICINSLYHKIKDENDGTQLDWSNFTNQSKAKGVDNVAFQSPPMYNEAPRAINSQVVIPMETANAKERHV